MVIRHKNHFAELGDDIAPGDSKHRNYIKGLSVLDSMKMVRKAAKRLMTINKKAKVYLEEARQTGDDFVYLVAFCRVCHKWISTLYFMCLYGEVFGKCDIVHFQLRMFCDRMEKLREKPNLLKSVKFMQSGADYFRKDFYFNRQLKEMSRRIHQKGKPEKIGLTALKDEMPSFVGLRGLYTIEEHNYERDLFSKYEIPVLEVPVLEDESKRYGDMMDLVEFTLKDLALVASAKLHRAYG